jgi:hypothetical protein
MPLAMAAMFFSTGIPISISEAERAPQDEAASGALGGAEG